MIYLIIVLDQETVKRSVRAGTDILLKCLSITRVKWYFNDGKLLFNSQSFDDNTLVVYDTEDFNSGMYECAGRNENFELTTYTEYNLKVYGNLNTACSCTIIF